MNPKDFENRLAVLSSQKGVLTASMSEITSSKDMGESGYLIFCLGTTDLKGNWQFSKGDRILSIPESVIIFEPEKIMETKVEKEKSEDWMRINAVMEDIVEVVGNDRLDKDQIFTRLFKAEKITKDDFELVSKGVRILREKRKLNLVKRGKSYLYFN